MCVARDALKNNEAEQQRIEECYRLFEKIQEKGFLAMPFFEMGGLAFGR
jgi:hypothetical protein